MTYRCAISLGRESVYGTPVTTGRAYEFSDEGFDLGDLDVEGEGYRSGDDGAREADIIRPIVSAKGSLTLQPTSKGMGLLLEELLGTGVSTLVSTGLYQQNFSFADTPKSVTVQKQLPARDQSILVQQFKGAVVTDWTLSMDAKGVLKLAINYDCRDAVATGLSADSLVYTIGTRFSFAGASFASGTYTAPTTTTLPAAGTAYAGVRAWSIKVDNKLDTDSVYTGGNSGLKDLPMPSDVREITMTADLELRDGTYQQAVRAGTASSFVATFTDGSTGQLVVGIPKLRPKGPLPKADKGLIVVSSQWKAYLDGTNPLLHLSTRTSDAALA